MDLLEELDSRFLTTIEQHESLPIEKRTDEYLAEFVEKAEVYMVKRFALMKALGVL